MRWIMQCYATILFVISSLFTQAWADEANNQMQMQFGGMVNVPTCTLVIPNKVVTLPSVMVSDFDKLTVGSIFGTKAFSVKVDNCKNGPAVIDYVQLSFEAKSGSYDSRYPAFTNNAIGVVSPAAAGIGAVITDHRDGKNVISNSFDSVPLIYQVSVYPVGSAYEFDAQYIKTNALVTSGYFLTEVIITASYG